MSAPAAAIEASPSPLDRVLRLFTEVRAGEAATALLLTLNVFLLLTSYYILKPVREALILTGGGAEVKSYASAGMAVLLLGLVPAYGALANRMPRRRLINVVTAFFAACLVVFYMLAGTRVPLGVVFFLWIGIFNMMVVAQFWAFANDVYSPEEGQRLFPIVGFGASSGAVLGSAIAGWLIEPLGVNQLLLLGGALLVAASVLTNIVDDRERRRTEAHLPKAQTTAEQPAATTSEMRAFRLKAPPAPPQNPFRLVLTNRYLLLIAVLVLLLNWVNTTGEYVLGRTVARAAAQAVRDGSAGGLTEAEYIGKFYAGFFSVVNLVGLGLQLFVVSRIVKYLGVRTAILFLPVIALLGYTLLAFVPVLAAVRWAKTAENATDYSLQNTVRNMLFLPTTREQKYKAKQAIDAFFVRVGDMLSAGLVYVGVTYFALSAQQFAMVNLLLAAVWLLVALLIGRAYTRLVAQVAPAAGG
jgi:AAA family ATP:ADP antiporter